MHKLTPIAALVAVAALALPVASWADEAPEEVPGSVEAFRAEADRHIDDWLDFGRSLCGAFVTAAERVAISV